MTEEKRANWGGKVEFILTCVGYAVGLGNIWRFPYLCYQNGGGAFLIPYFGMLFLVGIPLFFLELSFGQFASLGPIAIWKVNPFFKGLGYAMVTANTVISIYYNVVVAWALYFLFASMSSTVPWTGCNNAWNTFYCATADDYKNMSKGENETFIMKNFTRIEASELKSPSEEFFYRKVLQMSDGFENTGTIVWQLAVCLALSWLIVFVVLIKGISSLGKVVYVTSTFPYVLLTVMLVRGVTLEGAWKGIYFYLNPVWSKLAEAKVWSDAGTQIFFSLSTCTGGLIAMASYNNFNNNCQRDSLLVPIINCLTSFYGGFAIFSVLGYMATQKNVEVASVAASGPGLVFVVYPEALSTMPGAPVWSVLFFLMMMMLGLSSMFSIVECFFCAMMDEFPTLLRRSAQRVIIFRVVFCLIFYLIGLSMVSNGGFYLFCLVDAALSGFPLLITGLFEVMVLNYIYGFRRFFDDISMMLGVKPNIYFRVTWVVLTPIVLLFTTIFVAIQYKPLTLFSGRYHYPSYSQAVEWLIVGICVVFIPLVALIRYCLDGGYKVLTLVNKPREGWGPALDENRSGRYERRLHTTETSGIDGTIAKYNNEKGTIGTVGHANHGYTDNELWTASDPSIPTNHVRHVYIDDSVKF